MAAGRYDAELRACVSAIGSLFADEDAIDELFDNPYRSSKTHRLKTLPNRTSGKASDALFDAVDDYFREGRGV